MDAAPDNITTLVPIGEYKAPQNEAVGVLRARFSPETTALRDLWRRVTGKHKAEVVPVEPLDAAMLQALLPEPVTETFQSELDQALSEWAEAEGDRVRVVLYPPGHVGQSLESWARGRGYALPQGASRLDPLELPEDGRVCVVPHLHRHFLRRVGGLTAVRTFLLGLSGHEGNVLIGCNSWAWSFLRASLEVNSLLPEPMAFQALDADALEAWLAPKDTPVRLHKRDVDRDVFKDLAVRSQGIPSVAWEMWRQGLRKEEGGEGIVLDVVPGDVPIRRNVRESLLVLHAVLIHGELELGELAEMMTFSFSAEVTSALERDGFLVIERGRVRVPSLVYPTVRSLLVAAGYASDGLS